MNALHRVVGLSALVLFFSWMWSHFDRITGDRDGTIRFVLGSLFAVLILLRWKPADVRPLLPRWAIPVAGLAGGALTILGAILPVHQLEWLGIIGLLYACLRWALPDRYSRDIPLALLLLYWVHPLPGNIFGDLQAFMQQTSVKGAEWLLQVLNVRVWADGPLLHTGFRVFEVEAVCSGMRTAVTVLLCSLGVCLLLNLRWYENLVFVGLGLVQVLALNIVRISLMVMWSSRKPVEWSDGFLHDSLGLFLLLSILLVQVEASWWKMRRVSARRLETAVNRGEAEPPDRAHRLPRFWYIVIRYGWILIGVALVVAGLVYAGYKRRPAHRAAMISGVLEGLMIRDLDTAGRAVKDGLRYDPGSRELRSRSAQVMVMQGKSQESLAVLESLPAPLTLYESILKSWALVGVGRDDEAIALIDALPEPAKALPGVAMVRAEYGAKQNRPDAVSRNVVVASKSHLVVNRARALFPYLAAHEQWRAIVRSDNPGVPFADFGPALIAVHACLQMNDVGGAAGVMKRALATWPNDPRFLSSLFVIALSRPGAEWEDRFENLFRTNVGTLDVDRLASCLNYGFQLSKPELGWMAYVRLQAIDPADPALFMAAARFGDVWMTFRRRRVGLESSNPFENIDLRPLFVMTRQLEPFRSLWDRVPLGDEMADSKDPSALRRKYLDRCIEEIETREKEGRATARMQLLYPTALAMAGRFNEAHASLDRLAGAHPDKKAEILFQHAVFCDREGRWQEGYEALRLYLAEEKRPNLTAALLRIKALMNMNLGACAMDVAETARDMYPGSLQVEDIVAAILRTFGFHEEALFVLTRDGQNANPAIVVPLLYETGRHLEGDKVAQSQGVAHLRRPLPTTPLLFSAPAELSVRRQWPSYRSEQDRAREQAKFESMEKTATSPLVKAIGRMGAEWYRARGAGNTSNPARWKELGRDDLEQAALLNWLTTLLACDGQYAKAELPAREAAAVMPRSAVFRRILIAITEGDRAVVEEARKVCPSDPEIWLASFVSREEKEGSGGWALREIDGSASAFSPGTVVSAGDFCFRKGMLEAAAAAARHSIARGRGLLSAHVLGLRVALAQRDLQWALECALKGAELSVDPGPFYRAVVDLKAMGKGTDRDTTAALEYLQERFKNEARWAEQLGRVYFIKGDPRRALNVLEPIIDNDIRRVGGQSLVLAAEAARIDGRNAQAVSILEATYKLYPDKVSVLNNLVYNLAQDRRTLPRAMELLPKLTEMAGNSAAILDTIAMVYLRNGDVKKAADYMKRATEKLESSDYAALEIQLNAAEVLFRSGDPAGAKQKLELLRRDAARVPFVDSAARDLLSKVKQALDE